MYIIPYYNFIIAYFQDSTKYLGKSNDQILRENIINKSDNRIVISAQYLNLLKEYIEKNCEHLKPFLDIFTGWIDQNKLNNKIYNITSSNSKTICEEFKHLYNSISKQPYISIAEESDDCVKNRNLKIAILKESVKPNKNWLLINIAAFHKFNIEDYHFQDKSEVKDFLEEIFDIQSNISSVTIFDAFVNITKHDMFEYFVLRSIPFTYYSRRQFKDNGAEDNEKHRGILDALNNNLVNVTFKISSRVKRTHKRLIIFGDFIIRVDTDFSLLEPGSGDWEFIIKYDKNDIARNLSRSKEYKEFK